MNFLLKEVKESFLMYYDIVRGVFNSDWNSTVTDHMAADILGITVEEVHNRVVNGDIRTDWDGEILERYLRS